MHVNVYVCMYVCIHVCMHLCIYVCMYACSVYVCVCVHISENAACKPNQRMWWRLDDAVPRVATRVRHGRHGFLAQHMAPAPPGLVRARTHGGLWFG